MAKKTATKTKTTTVTSASPSEFDDPAGVTALLVEMAHPMKQVIEAIRETILGADPRITEGVKWNSPSFYCNGWFATVGGRRPDRLEIVLHHGAKVRHDATLQGTIKDSGTILKWASPDRATVTITSHASFESMRGHLAAVVKQWAAYQRLLAPKA